MSQAISNSAQASSGAPEIIGNSTSNINPVEFTARVRKLIVCRLEAGVVSAGMPDHLSQLVPGRMLRTRLGGRLSGLGRWPTGSETLRYACAATEMVHTASLLHDDVIDRGLIRRAHPALWQVTGPSVAVLVGDTLLCDAIAMVLKTEEGRLVESFVEKVRVVCRSEAEQELLCREKHLDEATCLRLARGKTGPLFAFVGQVCGGGDPSLTAALEEAGYRIGTAYQMADDLLDVVGDEQSAGKTLGSDQRRGKFTLALSRYHGTERAREQVSSLCLAALKCVEPWPQAVEAISTFLRRDLQQVFDRCVLGLDIG